MPVCEAAWVLRGGLFRERRLDALGVPHGVTTRALGDMKSPEARLAAAASRGLGGFPLRVLRQAHGDVVLREEDLPPGIEPQADGLVGGAPGRVLSVFVADCLPIFLWDEPLSAVGIVHAGWRGLSAGIAARGVRAMERLGADVSRLRAAVGPHVGACCYRVGPELEALFPESARRRGGFPYVDLGAEAARRLVRAGLKAGRVVSDAPCTACEPGLFSYRRDKSAGRMLAFIALPGGGS